VFFGTLVLAFLTQSQATYCLAWYALGGLPLWFVALLVFRQHELAELERLDLDELRREKAATGGGEAIFEAEGAAGLAFRVAEARLTWMRRWLVPGFGVVSAVYLCIWGFLLFRRLSVARGVVGTEKWAALANLPVALVILAVLLVGGFLMSRLTSGLARRSEWQLLRGCGSYLLGNVLAIIALMVCFGVALYANVPSWEHTLAYIIPVMMIVLGGEGVVNFVLDIYRPRSPGVEPRACFDSRILALFAEPGGIAQAIAEAINYQFGVRVSQTWFYQLLERTLVPLVGAGFAAVWLMTCVIIVQPYEHVIVERFGKQLNSGAPGQAAPLGPGMHFKYPWPFETARAFNTGQLHQISVGWKTYDATPTAEPNAPTVLLWTDETHKGLQHFDFITYRKPDDRPESETPREPADSGADQLRAIPVNSIRMEIAIQFRIKPELLYKYVQTAENPERTIRNVAWEEVTRFAAASTVDFLLGQDVRRIAEHLKTAVSRRVEDVGLEVVYVGVTNVHPEMTVAQAYREVIGAELQKVASIREARVTEDQRLSAVAGDATTARVLADLTARARHAAEQLNAAFQVLSAVPAADLDALRSAGQALAEPIKAKLVADAQLELARQMDRVLNEDFELGLGQNIERLARSAEAVKVATAAAAKAEDALRAPLERFRADAAKKLAAGKIDALVAMLTAELAVEHWERELDRAFGSSYVSGEAAAALAAAQADRWSIEMQSASEMARATLEREAFRVAPSTYRSLRLMETIAAGVHNARKYFLAFDPKGREVRLRLVTEDDKGSVIDLTRTQLPRP
jgi:regulator of protease activity HflC (stomatin/prohibitin superfamily)